MAIRVVKRLAQRKPSWDELEQLLRKLPTTHATRRKPDDLLRLAHLYREVCADLMRADAYDLPQETVDYLDQLVARAHNELYRSERVDLVAWLRGAFLNVPRQLRRSPWFYLSLVLFYGGMTLFAMVAYFDPDFALDILPEGMAEQAAESFANTLTRESLDDDALMYGFYIYNNAGIGLRCYTWGLLFGIGSVYILIQQTVYLGLLFGYILGTPSRGNFLEFVTAHGPFELTAIAISATAGLHLGLGLIAPGRQPRLQALRDSALRSLPLAGTAATLFILAAFIEGFISASSLPYAVKLAVALVTAAMLLAYIGLGGLERHRGGHRVGS